VEQKNLSLVSGHAIAQKLVMSDSI